MKYRLVTVTIIRVKLFQFISGSFVFNAKLLWWITRKSGWNQFSHLLYADYTWICRQENNSSLPFMYIFLDCGVVCGLYWGLFFLYAICWSCMQNIQFLPNVQMENTSSVSVLSALIIHSFIFKLLVHIYTCWHRLSNGWTV